MQTTAIGAPTERGEAAQPTRLFVGIKIATDIAEELAKLVQPLKACPFGSSLLLIFTSRWCSRGTKPIFRRLSKGCVRRFVGCTVSRSHLSASPMGLRAGDPGFCGLSAHLPRMP